MSKPENAFKDSSALAEKNHSRYQKQMSKNKYWKLGYKAGKKNKKKEENPYSLTDEMRKLLKKRTYWEMGHEEAAWQPPKKKHEKHRHKKRHK